MKNWKLTSTIAALICTTNVNAALIDNGYFTTDDVSGLDWLDLSETVDMSMTAAASNNPGWRLPTYAETVDLFNYVFDGYYHTHTNGSSSSIDPGHYVGLVEDTNLFIDLFGVTGTFDSGFAESSIGWYCYQDASFSCLPSQIGATRIQDGGFYGERYTVYGLGNEFGGLQDPLSPAGVFLVRTSVIPVPAAVWLFGSGLLGLMGIARHYRRPAG